MNFIVIDGTVANTKRQLKIEKDSIKRVLSQNPVEVYNNKLLLVENKLKALSRFEKSQRSRTKYQKIQHLRVTNPVKYTKECTKLCKGVPGISFNPNNQLFRVQKTFSKKRAYGGQFDTFDDAVEGLEILISINQKRR